MITLNSKEVVFEVFPNGEMRLATKDLFVSDNKMANIDWKYENDSDFMKLFFLKKELDNYSHRCDLLIRYMPYSRMDRTEGTYAFTLKHSASFINDLHFDSVTVVDPHSDVTLAVLDRSRAVYPLRVDNLSAVGSSNDLVYYPDLGALKKYSKLYPNIPFAYGIKNRDFKTGNIDRLDVVGDVKDKNIIMIDDLCAYGGTFIKSAEVLSQMGAKNMTLVVTHCEHNIFKGSIPTSPLIQKVITTDTIISNTDGKVTVLKLTDLLTTW